MTPLAHIDDAQCRRLARALGAIAPAEEWFIPRVPDVDSAVEADFWCLLIAICQQTRTVRGVVDGAPFRGSDYLIWRARARVIEDPGCFLPEAVRFF